MATSMIPLRKSYTSGTDGIWTYRKYEDGTYHAWYVGSLSFAAGTAWAGGYYHISNAGVTPPSFSTSVTSMSGSPNGAVLVVYIGCNQSDHKLYVFNGTQAATGQIALRIDMYGTW